MPYSMNVPGSPTIYVDAYLRGLPDALKNKIRFYPLVGIVGKAHGASISLSDKLEELPPSELADGELALIVIHVSFHYVALACYKEAASVKIYYHDSGHSEISIIERKYGEYNIAGLLTTLFSTETTEITMRNDFSQTDHIACGFCAAKFLIYATQKFEERGNLTELPVVDVNPFLRTPALARLSLIRYEVPRERIIESSREMVVELGGRSVRSRIESIYLVAMKEICELSADAGVESDLKEIKAAVLAQDVQVLRYIEIFGMMMRKIGYHKYKEILDSFPTLAHFLEAKKEAFDGGSLSPEDDEVRELLELLESIIPVQTVITEELLHLKQRIDELPVAAAAARSCRLA